MLAPEIQERVLRQLPVIEEWHGQRAGLAGRAAVNGSRIGNRFPLNESASRQPEVGLWRWEGP